MLAVKHFQREHHLRDSWGIVGNNIADREPSQAVGTLWPVTCFRININLTSFYAENFPVSTVSKNNKLQKNDKNTK